MGDNREGELVFLKLTNADLKFVKFILINLYHFQCRFPLLSPPLTLPTNLLSIGQIFPKVLRIYFLTQSQIFVNSHRK